MKIFKKKRTLLLLGIPLISLFLNTPLMAGCPGGLNDRADVVSNPAGNDYDVYFTDDDVTDNDYFTATRAGWVRDALSSTHNILVNPPHNFSNPSFSASPNDTCISDSGNLGTAPNDIITLDSPGLISSTEPYTRTVTGHELFHHVEYAYINFNDWPSWGAWTVEATARAMEDKMTLDNDTNPANTFYVGEINNYLANPNRTLMDISYTAAIFWVYLTEQLGTPNPEPARGVDFIQRFWNFTSGNSPDSVRYLRDTINSFDSSETLEDLFQDFSITNYTHDLDVSALPNPGRYQYFDESAAGGGTAYDAVVRTTIPAQNTTYSDSVERWGSRFFEIDIDAGQKCEVIGFWGKTTNGKKVAWSMVGIKNGTQVTEIFRSVGSSFYKALINPPGDSFDKLALIVTGLNDDADFDYAFGTGPSAGSIRLPKLDRMAYVGEKNDPERFQARLNITGPSVLTPDGSGTVSVKGLDPSLFEVKLRSVSTGNTYPVTIVNSNYVSGEYWMVLQAPEITDPLDGDLYDLEICFCERSGSCVNSLVSKNAVLYADITTNQMLVIDRSFSMHYPTSDPKIEAAKNAARFYVDAASEDDRVGLVTFTGNNSECDHDATVNSAIAFMTPANRNNVINDINNIVEDGWTSIGDGLKDGRNQLLTVASPADVHSIVLESDGRENEGDFWDRPNPDCGTPAVRDSFQPGGIAESIRIDTIGFGSDANQLLLQNIAATTEGDYYYVSTDSPASAASSSALSASTTSAALSAPSSSSLEVANRLANVHRSIQEDVNNQDRLFYQADNFAGGMSTTVLIPVTEKQGGGVRDGVFAFNWENPAANLKVTLVDPNGNTINSGLPLWTVVGDKTNKTYRYDKILEPGTWEVNVTVDDATQLISMLSGRIVQGVDIDVYFSQVLANLPSRKCDRNPLYAYMRGLPVTILANLNDLKGGIAGLTVEAQISNPNGSTNTLTLFDDGDHDDGVAGDGIYGNFDTRTPFYSSTGVADFPDGPPSGDVGSYTVVVRAQGASNHKEEFQRIETRSFQVFEYGNEQECKVDSDNDGLPDRWEDLYGLDKTNPSDVNDDNDNDGLRNKDEFFYGTLPFDADTDKGGESDGSEVKAGRDPLYNKDDLLPAIVDYGVITQRIDIPVHIPKPFTNILHFPVNDNYQTMQIWRTDPNWAGFKMVEKVDLVANPSGVFYDEGLKEGFSYKYYLVAEGLSGAQTAPTDVFTGTPKANPVPPKGWLFINHGAIKTDRLTLLLQVDTSSHAKEMKISENADFSGAVWEPLKTDHSFVLSPQDDGLVTLYAKYRDADSNESIVYSANIIVAVNGDEDGDGIANFLDLDDDDDGLTDKMEIFQLGTDPFKKDSNGNGVGDADEDPDRDLISTIRELKFGIDPLHNLSDVSGDDRFNALDINVFRNAFNAGDNTADVNNDGKTNALDINGFRNAFRNERSFK